MREELFFDQRPDVVVDFRYCSGCPQHDEPLAFKARNVAGIIDEWMIQAHGQGSLKRLAERGLTAVERPSSRDEAIQGDARATITDALASSVVLLLSRSSFLL